MNGALVKLEVVDAVGHLPNPVCTASKALPALHVRNGSLHEVTLLPNQVTAWMVSNR